MWIILGESGIVSGHSHRGWQVARAGVHHGHHSYVLRLQHIIMLSVSLCIQCTPTVKLWQEANHGNLWLQPSIIKPITFQNHFNVSYYCPASLQHSCSLFNINNLHEDCHHRQSITIIHQPSLADCSLLVVIGAIFRLMWDTTAVQPVTMQRVEGLVCQIRSKLCKLKPTTMTSTMTPEVWCICSMWRWYVTHHNRKCYEMQIFLRKSCLCHVTSFWLHDCGFFVDWNYLLKGTLSIYAICMTVSVEL